MSFNSDFINEKLVNKILETNYRLKIIENRDNKGLIKILKCIISEEEINDLI